MDDDVKETTEKKKETRSNLKRAGERRTLWACSIELGCRLEVYVTGSAAQIKALVGRPRLERIPDPGGKGER